MGVWNLTITDESADEAHDRYKDGDAPDYEFDDDLSEGDDDG